MKHGENDDEEHKVVLKITNAHKLKTMMKSASESPEIEQQFEKEF